MKNCLTCSPVFFTKSFAECDLCVTDNCKVNKQLAVHHGSFISDSKMDAIDELRQLIVIMALQINETTHLIVFNCF